MPQSTRWSSSTAFIFAQAAAAVGLGNIWRFPYLAGQNGGGAFVIVYLILVIILGVPLMTSEVIIGRIGRCNPVASLKNVAIDANRSRHWGILGGVTVLASFLILSYYIVIAGWVLDYFFRACLGHFKMANEIVAAQNFQALQDNPWQMLVTDSAVMLATVGVIGLGIKRGLERTVMWMFPALIALMVILLIYAMTTDGFVRGLLFLFKPNFHQLTPKVILMALGQTFFSLNIAMGIIIMFSAYLPEKSPLVSSVIAIIIADTGIACLAGMIIFPIVFSNGLQPAAGPSLIFRTLPIAFGHLPLGNVVGAIFFLLLLFAAFTSAISLLEVSVAWLIENHHIKRSHAVIICGIACWILSLGTIASFSHDEHFHLFHITFFKGIDYLTSAIMLPLGGFLIAIFSGWLLPKRYIHAKLGWHMGGFWFKCWRFIKRYLAPIAILLILLSSIGIV